MTDAQITVIGGGLAGPEAAWAAAHRGVRVALYEMKPARKTPAHALDALGELVCSNSLGSMSPGAAPALLKEELLRLGSLVMNAALEARVPAGKALAVDRHVMADIITDTINAHPLVEVYHEEVTDVPAARPVVIATGPLTSDALSHSVQDLIGAHTLSFYDALSPIVEDDSIDRSIAFAASRYDAGEEPDGDYLNCPFTKDEYMRFVDAIVTAERMPYHSFENLRDFEGCKPIEELAERGAETLAFGPFKPVGLTDPRTGKRPYAVVQLRRENETGTMWSLVGCQTKMTYPEQRRVFRMVPGLHKAVFARLGSLHRNTFLDAPQVLNASQEFHAHPGVFCAGQLTGVEGYVESSGSGVLAGLAAAARVTGGSYSAPPAATALGALMRYISEGPAGPFQPMNINFGLLPPVEKTGRMSRKDRRAIQCDRARAALSEWITMQELTDHQLGDAFAPWTHSRAA